MSCRMQLAAIHMSFCGRGRPGPLRSSSEPPPYACELNVEWDERLRGDPGIEIRRSSSIPASCFSPFREFADGDEGEPGLLADEALRDPRQERVVSAARCDIGVDDDVDTISRGWRLGCAQISEKASSSSSDSTRPRQVRRRSRRARGLQRTHPRSSCSGRSERVRHRISRHRNLRRCDFYDRGGEHRHGLQVVIECLLSAAGIDASC